ALTAPEDAEAWYALLFALAVEAAAMSVLLTAETTTHQPRNHGDATRVAKPVTPLRIAQRERDSAVNTGRVLDWMRERALPTEEVNPIALEALHADYDVWCIRSELQAMPIEAFSQALDRLREEPELAGNIKKFGSR